MGKKATRTIRNYLAVARGEGMVLVRVLGLGNMNSAPALREFADEQRAAGFQRFVFDLAQCRGMDSTFMGCLVGIHASLKRGSGAYPAVESELADNESLKAAARAAMAGDAQAEEGAGAQGDGEAEELSREEALAELEKSLAQKPPGQDGGAKRAGPGFVIAVNVSAECRELMNILGVDKFVKIYGNVDLSLLEMTPLPEKKLSSAERHVLILQAHENLVEIDKRNEAKFGAFLRSLSEELAKVNKNA